MKIIWLSAVIVIAACGPSRADVVDSTIKLFQFQPKTLEVKTGTTVKWLNGDDIEHSVTAGAPGNETGAFDSGFFRKSEGFEFTFIEPGTYSYFCKRHPSMTAAVAVSP